jgi:hypothetical protein
MASRSSGLVALHEQAHSRGRKFSELNHLKDLDGTGLDGAIPCREYCLRIVPEWNRIRSAVDGSLRCGRFKVILFELAVQGGLANSKDARGR